MNFLTLIEAKRDGARLTPEQIRQFVDACVAGELPDYQVSAFLMAVYFRGLDEEETAALTLAMRDSGDVLRFPADPRPLADKHSTGGVGDKVSLPLAPLLACLGFRVPMISGRALGITGGTLDKLETIPGFQTRLTPAQILETVQRVGCVICGQTERMAPADRRLYALRDVTGTVPSLPLIVASILSKKLAEGLDALVLDVKFGSAAFMRTRDEARALARAMVRLAMRCGVNTRALLTDMNTPLGRAAGNWLEVRESVACLTPRRLQPAAAATSEAAPDDLRELVLACAAHLLVQTGKATSLDAARAQAATCLDSGEPLQKWREMLQAQGADLDAYERKVALDHTAPALAEVRAEGDGFVARCDARVVGEVIRDLGGGRLTRDAPVNGDVGVDRLAKPGDAVRAGDVLARVHAPDGARAEAARDRLRSAFELSPHPPVPPPLVVETVTAA